MVGIFLVFLIVQGLILFNKQKIAILLGLLNLVFMLGMLYYHATTVLQIRL